MGSVGADGWPRLRLRDWRPTCETLHRCLQIAGKVRLALATPLNHWWQVAFYVYPRGLESSLIPYGADRTFEIRFDLVDHRVRIRTGRGGTTEVALRSRPVAEFHRELFERLAALDLHPHIVPVPVEMADRTRLDKDEVHGEYDPAAATRFLGALRQAHVVLSEFAGRFQGKQSPVHFFWGGFDLASTRFSGRPAPPRPPRDPVQDRIDREAYSHEVMSFGFWPGTPDVSDTAFCAYAAPEPEGFRRLPGLPAGASYHDMLGEYLLPYETVRTSASPKSLLMDFLQTVYVGGATLGRWDRKSLDRPGWAPAPPAEGPGAVPAGP